MVLGAQLLNSMDYSKFRIKESSYNNLKGSQWPTYTQFIRTKLEDLHKLVPNKLIEEEILNHNNLAKSKYLNDYFSDTMWYNKELYPYLKIKFKKSDLIGENYSHAWQDMMILTLLDGKTNGTYLELGAGRPHYINNTFLLEYLFDWRGASIDIVDYSKSWQARPNSNFICADVLNIDYPDFLQKKYVNKQIDYLQIDIDSSPDETNELLSLVLSSGYRYSIITFETNSFLHKENPDRFLYIKKSRELLSNKGYQLLFSDILHYMHSTPNSKEMGWSANEDLWVDPTIIDQDLLEYFLNMKERNPFDILIEQ